MIKYTLQCDRSHAFEGWFRDSAAFDAQSAAGALACPQCGSTAVGKAIMAPRIGRASEARQATAVEPRPEGAQDHGAPAAALRAKLLELRRAVEAHCDDVGPAFAEEARKIHYGEADPRGIYGQASREDAEALRDEGIEIAAVPWVSRGDA
jgi:hypothetical protein